MFHMLRPCRAYMCQGTMSSLVQVMASLAPMNQCWPNTHWACEIRSLNTEVRHCHLEEHVASPCVIYISK